MLNILIYLLGSAALILFLLCVFLVFTTKPYSTITRYKAEDEYWDPKEKRSHKFADIAEPAIVYLSIVVPAYNEEKRLPSMLDETLEYLEQQKKSRTEYTYEIIVVSDGSTDGTVEVVNSYSEKYGTERVKCLKLIKNRGKGGAVRLGVQSSRGALILFADADGATTFEDLQKLEKSLEAKVGRSIALELTVADQNAIVIGSRAHLEKESLATRSIFRTILMYGFHFLVWLFTVRGVGDTQCGFKLFTRQSARVCFDNLHVERWAFDVELLYIAQRLNIPISEVSVRWTEIDGSKVTPVWSWLQMGCDLGLIWLRYTLGAWKLRTETLQAAPKRPS